MSNIDQGVHAADAHRAKATPGGWTLGWQEFAALPIQKSDICRRSLRSREIVRILQSVERAGQFNKPEI